MEQPVPEIRPTPGPTSWPRVLAMGMVLYIAGVLILLLTRNTRIYPAVTLVGNFVVPVAYVTFFYDHRHLSTLSVSRVAKGFVIGGIFSVLVAALIEPIFIHRLTAASSIRVGLIEELTKIIGVVVVASKIRHDSEVDGIILGTATGMGFAALESTGYAFTAFIGSGGNIPMSVGVTLFRGLFSPIGHGVWTAIFAGALFRESRPYRFRVDLVVIGAYLFVALLHGLWDGVPASLMRHAQQNFPAIIIVQILLAFLGVFVLWGMWNEAIRRQDAASTSQEQVSSEGSPNHEDEQQL